MIRLKLVVPHTIIQIGLMSFIYYVMLIALNPCKPAKPLIVDDTLMMVLGIFTAVMTFPAGWAAVFSFAWIIHPVLFLFVMVATSVANSWLWNELYSQWREFWDGYKEKRRLEN